MANSLLTTEFTQVLQKVVMEVVNDPTTYVGSRYMPSVAIPTDEIFVDVIEATGGLTNEHMIGTQPKYIQRFGIRTQSFKPPAYKESIRLDEKDILHLRKLGENDRSQRGIRQYVDKIVDQLDRRTEARIEKLRWDAIFNGGISYLGSTISFGLPSQNRAVPVTAVWSSDLVNENNSSNPLLDIRYWTEGGYAPFRKYKITKMLMNPNTERWILNNTNTRSFISSLGANPVFAQFDLQAVLKYAIPGAPSVEVYKGWYQNQVQSGNQTTVGDAVYFIPDGYIFFECSLPDGDRIGEFVQGLHLSSGSIDNPGYGKFLVIDDNTAPGTKGGPANPYVDVIGGVYGGPKFDRPFDVLTAKVI
jgi:hypothetical protein